MYIDPILSKELAKKWNISLDIVDSILKEYKDSESKRKFIQEMIESEW